MSQKDEVRITINKLFEAAGVRYTYRGEVTEQTAAIIGRVVADINSCTTALNWVPRPTGGKATITWVARNMGTAFARQMDKKKVSIVCGKRVLLGIRSDLELSGIGL